MREITDLNELHGIVLDTLKYLDAVCREHKLTYFLSGGTALGAIRHKGFIPWDDDADVMLPRADYEKLVALLTAKEDARYAFGCIHNRADWSFPFARIWDKRTQVVYDNLNEAPTGMFIDIFPMDGLSDSAREMKLHYRRVRLWNVCLNAAIRKRFKPGEGYRTLKTLTGKLMRVFGTRRICARIDHLAKKHAFEPANHVGCAVLSHYMERECFPRHAFDRGVYVPFEDTQLAVPNGYDAYLSALYGDYMTPPPAGDRESDHHMHVYIN